MHSAKRLGTVSKVSVSILIFTFLRKMVSNETVGIPEHSKMADAFYDRKWEMMEYLIERGADVEVKLNNWFIEFSPMNDPNLPINWGKQHESLITRAKNNPSEEYAKAVFSGLAKRRETYFKLVADACESRYAEDTNTISAGRRLPHVIIKTLSFLFKQIF